MGFHGGFHHRGWRPATAFMSVEDEIKMLEAAKEELENQLKNVNERLAKLKA
jgi:hypothetical protein